MNLSTEPIEPESDNAEFIPAELPVAPVAPTLFSRAKKYAYTIGVSFLIVGLQLIQGILLARLLGPVGRGEYATAVFYPQLLLYVGLLGGIEVICRYALKPGMDLFQLRRSALRLSLITGTVTTVVALACSLLALPPDKQYLLPQALICSLGIIGQQMALLVTAVDRGADQFTRYNVLRMIAAGLFPVLLLGWALCFKLDVMQASILSVIAASLGGVLCLYGLPQPLSGTGISGTRQLLAEGRPYAISMVAIDLFERLDLMMILWLTSLETQGFYAAMVPAAYPLTVAPNTLGVFLFNVGAREGQGLTYRQFNRFLIGIGLFQAVSTVVFILLIGPVVTFVYEERYAPAVIFAQWLAPVAAVKGILQSLDAYVRGRGMPLAGIHIRWIATIVMLGFIAATFHTYGAVSIPMGCLVAQLVCFVWLCNLVYLDIRRRKPT